MIFALTDETEQLTRLNALVDAALEKVIETPPREEDTEMYQYRLGNQYLDPDNLIYEIAVMTGLAGLQAENNRDLLRIMEDGDQSALAYLNSYLDPKPSTKTDQLLGPG